MLKTKTINYEEIIDDVMHVIVKKSLEHVEENKLPGDHHFYISFFTNYSGVILSDRMKAQYPEEITIVIQYQFENLIIEEDRFSIVLAFNNIKEKIIVPYMAITAFSDPSVKFGLKFTHKQKSEEASMSKKEVELPTKKECKSPKAQQDNNVIVLDKFLKK